MRRLSTAQGRPPVTAMWACVTGGSSRPATSTNRPRKPLTQRDRRSRQALSTLHTHYDAQLFWDPTASPSVQHGVTTVFGGNCGFTLAPAGTDQQDYLTRMLARVEGMPLDALRAGLDWQWSSFGDWLARPRQAHGNQRRLPGGPQCDSACGDGRRGGRRRGDTRADRQDDRAARCGTGRRCPRAVDVAVEHPQRRRGPAGASRSASREELLALAAAVRAHPGTQLEAIIPGCLSGFTDDDIALLTDMSRAADRPLNWKRPRRLGGQPRRARKAVARIGSRRGAGWPRGRAHPAALDEDSAVVPVRLRSSTGCPAGARRCTCQWPSVCGRSPIRRCVVASTTVPTRRRPESFAALLIGNG